MHLVTTRTFAKLETWGTGGQNTENRILHCRQTVRVRRNRQRFRYASKTGKATLPRARRPTRTRIETIFTFLTEQPVFGRVTIFNNTPRHHKYPSPSFQLKLSVHPTCPNLQNLASPIGNTTRRRFDFWCFLLPLMIELELSRKGSIQRMPIFLSKSSHDSSVSQLQDQ